MVFVVSSLLLSIFVTYVSTVTGKVMYFLLFSSKQKNCFSNSFAKDYDKIIIIVRSIVKKYRNFFRYTIL